MRFLKNFHRIGCTARGLVAIGNHTVGTFYHILIPLLHAALEIMVGKGDFFIRFFQNFNVAFFIRVRKIFFLTVAGDAGDQLYVWIFSF